MMGDGEDADVWVVLGVAIVAMRKGVQVEGVWWDFGRSGRSGDLSRFIDVFLRNGCKRGVEDAML